MQMLEKKIKSLPQSAGVYQFFNKDGKLLYIGKAKKLKNRVKSYFKFSPSLAPSSNLSPRIYNMISQTENLEHILVESEHDALILENSLIKQLKPRYNILLRDDKTYPYIMIDMNESFPRFEITRRVVQKKGIKYFGPFSTSSKDILNAIYLLFNLVQKKGCLKSKEPCLFYQIGRCHAPCTGKISQKEYATIVENALEALKNRKVLISKLQEKMFQVADMQNYEEASTIRDMITSIQNSLHVTQVDLANMENIDIFGVYKEKNNACIMKIFIREGKVISTDYDIFKNSQSFEISELYKRSLLSFYQKNSVLLSQKILVADDFEERIEMEKFLSDSLKKRVDIKVPKRGEKAKLVNLALKNAKHILQNEKNKNSSIEENIKKLFDLEETPYRIEVFDNSHLGGEATVGAMIVWDGKFQKNSYRKFILKGEDEYSQMKELLNRRADEFKNNPPPNLWLLDGGETLLKLALSILNEKGINLEVLAISKEKLDAKSIRAKGRAKDIIHSKDRSFSLPSSDKRLQFLQKLRDEAHRFAITFHREKKIKKDKENNLTQIDGIGTATVKKLLLYFGSYEKIYNASFEELSTIINKNLAKKIWASLKPT